MTRWPGTPVAHRIRTTSNTSSTPQRDTYAVALEELRAGQERGHRMWFVVPQVAGLGHGTIAARYAIGSRAEAGARAATTAR